MSEWALYASVLPPDSTHLAHRRGMEGVDQHRNLQQGRCSDELLAQLRLLGTGQCDDRSTLPSFKKASLVGADLSKLNLSQLDLSGADLSCADLSGSNLSATQLRAATLFQANLTEAELLGADLSGADLSRCQAMRAGFGGVDLSGARLGEANLRGASFARARLDEADLHCADLRKARIRDADLRGADLSRCDLRGADLSASRVTGACFDESDLREARIAQLEDFERARWIGVDIRGTDFRAALRMRRLILDQNYLEEFRKASRISAVLYYIWWITSDCGRSFLRWASWTGLTMLFFAGLYSFFL